MDEKRWVRWHFRVVRMDIHTAAVEICCSWLDPAGGAPFPPKKLRMSGGIFALRKTRDGGALQFQGAMHTTFVLRR